MIGYYPAFGLKVPAKTTASTPNSDFFDDKTVVTNGRSASHAREDF
jgi:hypothetical protein